MYEIEKNIPAPGATSEFPFDKMTEGDSFLIPFPAEVSIAGEEESQHIARIQGRVAAAARKFRDAGNADFKYMTRRVEDGVRVWRTD